VVSAKETNRLKLYEGDTFATVSTYFKTKSIQVDSAATVRCKSDQNITNNYRFISERREAGDSIWRLFARCSKYTGCDNVPTFAMDCGRRRHIPIVHYGPDLLLMCK